MRKDMLVVSFTVSLSPQNISELTDDCSWNLVWTSFYCMSPHLSI